MYQKNAETFQVKTLRHSADATEVYDHGTYLLPKVTFRRSSPTTISR